MRHTDSTEAVFILVEPQVPENIGFTCRSLKNMGFNDLRIVGKSREELQQAHVTAYQAHDLLENIKFYDRLLDAAKDIDLLIGTTARNRKNRNQLISSQKLNQFIVDRREHVKRYGVVFGNESNGLSNEDERLCHILSTIPMKTSYPSINLSHSVMIYAYELAQFQSSDKNISKAENSISFKVFDNQIQELLRDKGLDKRQPELFQRTLDSLRLIPSVQIPMIMSLIRYFRR